jgi:DNA-binding transcriptional MerR regulator
MSGVTATFAALTPLTLPLGQAAGSTTMSETTTTELLSIGAFARRSRLSLKALRLYDRLSLLVPARVDEGTGYRYYAADQVERARLIGLLRRLDMPLQRVAAVLDLPAHEAVAEIGRFWSEIEASGEVKRRLIAHLERHLEGRGEHMYEVRQRDVPEQRVLSRQRALTVDQLPQFIEDAFGQLNKHASDAGARMTGNLFVIYHGEVNQDSDGPVEVCLPIDGPVEPRDGITVRVEPAHREAYVTITRAQTDFPGILDAYAAVDECVQSNGHTISASPREVYFADESEVAPDEPFCDVAFPIEA